MVRNILHQYLLENMLLYSISTHKFIIIMVEINSLSKKFQYTLTFYRGNR